MSNTECGKGKQSISLSQVDFVGIKKRGNTHYCFHCGGGLGFALGKGGEVSNHMDARITLIFQGKYVLVREALRDIKLGLHMADSLEHPRYKLGDGRYEEWLGNKAQFEYSPAFAQWCEENGYVVCRHNPMEGHDPVTHANAVVGGVNRFNSADEWLNANIPVDFPYKVIIA